MKIKEAIKKEILNEVTTSEFCSFTFLATKSKTSISTIKRYCLELQKERRLKVVRGGISLIDNFPLTNQYKKNIKTSEKTEIAKQAIKLIKENDVIFLDSGTTIIEVAKLFLKNSPITIFTNNLDIVNYLRNKKIKTYFVGGVINFTTYSTTGSLALETISQIRFSISFLGCNGFDKDNFYTTNMEESIFKKRVIERSSKSYFLADKSKENVKCNYKIIEKNRARHIFEK